MSNRWSTPPRRKGFFASLTDPFGLIWVLLIAAFVALMAAGWVMNIVAIWNATVFDGETIIRVIAVFLWPIGCVLGWFT